MGIKAAFFLSFLFDSLCICATKEAEVSCALGAECALPCCFKAGPYTSIHWRKTPEDLNVHSYFYREDQLQQQHFSYKGRTSLSEEINTGKVSLLLKNVQAEDAGKYMCVTSTISDSSITTVNLKVYEDIYEVELKKQGSELICSSEGIRTVPEVIWSVPLFMYVVSTNVVSQRVDNKLYNVHSSVSPLYNYDGITVKCTVKTAHNQKTAQHVEYSHVFKNDAVLRCSDVSAAIKSLIWKFNNTEEIVSRTESELHISESWRPFVDAVTESNRLVLKNLIKAQEGDYSCNIQTDKDNFVSLTHLRIEIQPFLEWLPYISALMVGVFLLGYAACYFITDSSHYSRRW